MSLPPAQGIVKGQGIVVSQSVVDVEKITVVEDPPTLTTAIVGTGVVLGDPD
jgi:hypothetical protein